MTEGAEPARIVMPRPTASRPVHGLMSRRGTPPEPFWMRLLVPVSQVLERPAQPEPCGWIRVERPTWPCSTATCRRVSAPPAHPPKVAFPAHPERWAIRPPQRAGDPFHPDLCCIVPAQSWVIAINRPCSSSRRRARPASSVSRGTPIGSPSITSTRLNGSGTWKRSQLRKDSFQPSR